MSGVEYTSFVPTLAYLPVPATFAAEELPEPVPGPVVITCLAEGESTPTHSCRCQRYKGHPALHKCACMKEWA